MSDVDLDFGRQERVNVAAVEDPALLYKDLLLSWVIVSLSGRHLCSLAYFFVLLHLQIANIIIIR